MSGSTLLVIDVQAAAFTGEWAMPDGEELIAACQRALAWARAQGHAVIWVQHHEPGGAFDGAGFAIEPRLADITAPTLIMAPFASHFVSTDLARMLSARVALNEIVWFPGHTHGLVLSGGALAAETLLNFIRRHTGEPE